MVLRIDKHLGRYFLKDEVRRQVRFEATPQCRGQPAPPIEKPVDPTSIRVVLPNARACKGIARTSVRDAIRQRHSCREYLQDPLSLDELAFLLWATQGLSERPGPHAARRTVPSAGNRHAFETYLVARRVAGLPPAIYRYLPIEHQVVALPCPMPSAADVAAATLGQGFVGRAAVVFFWTAVVARMEWRYAEASYKLIALDAGHVGQNLYLACECVGAGTCVVAAYDQTRCDRLLGVDGQDEFVVYLGAVGKRANGHS